MEAFDFALRGCLYGKCGTLYLTSEVERVSGRLSADDLKEQQAL